MGLIKKRIRQFLYLLVNLRTYICLKYYKSINYKKKKLFIYTDSRGFEISKISNRKSPFSSYLFFLIKNYNCDVFICPEKHTTIFDFLYTFSKHRNTNYDFVIAHIGVVDFSPRPISTIKAILELKKIKIETCFNPLFYKKVINIKIYPEKFLNEQTGSIVHSDFIDEIAEKFNKIKNLIWITCNPVDTNWRGNYSRDRPVNINIVNDKSIMMKELLNDNIHLIDLTRFTKKEIHKYTCDNIHMSIEGMELIANELKKTLH